MTETNTANRDRQIKEKCKGHQGQGQGISLSPPSLSDHEKYDQEPSREQETAYHLVQSDLRALGRHDVTRELQGIGEIVYRVSDGVSDGAPIAGRA